MSSTMLSSFSGTGVCMVVARPVTTRCETLAPRHAVVGAAHGEAAGVVDAVEELNGTRLVVHDGDGIVHRLLMVAAFLPVRIALDSLSDTCAVLRVPPRFFRRPWSVTDES